MGPEEIDRTNRIELTRIQSGVFLAIGSLIAPITLPLVWILLHSDFLKNSLLEKNSILVMGVMLAAVTALWAGSIVRCVTDIVREYSATSRFGLFLLLITPMIWLFLSVAYAYFATASAITSYLTGAGLITG